MTFMREYVLSDEQREEDERVLADILSSSYVTSRRLRGGNFLGSHCGCAIGVVTAARGLTRRHESDTGERHVDDHRPSTRVTFFAEALGVPRAYAVGVSDGFEVGMGTHVSCESYTTSTTDKHSDEYMRGYAVGMAAAESADARYATRE